MEFMNPGWLPPIDAWNEKSVAARASQMVRSRHRLTTALITGHPLSPAAVTPTVEREPIKNLNTRCPLRSPTMTHLS
jgi:hypothetical protein